MELLLGSHVREHGNRVGQLAGFELEPSSNLIRRVIFSPDGDLGPATQSRPLAAVALVHQDGEIDLRVDVDSDPLPAVGDVVLLSRATRLIQAGRQIGRLVGLDVQPGDRSIISAFGRAHWWSRRFGFTADRGDFSNPGEIRLRSAGTSRAA